MLYGSFCALRKLYLVEDDSPSSANPTPSVLEKTFTERQLKKEQIIKDRARHQHKMQRQRTKKEAEWKARTETSPFVGR